MVQFIPKQTLGFLETIKAVSKPKPRGLGFEPLRGAYKQSL